VLLLSWRPGLKGSIVLAKARATAVVFIILGSASASLARDAGRPPTIDIQKTCRETVAALNTGLGGEIGQDMNVCLMDEQEARNQIVKDWADYPAIAKDRCVNPKDYLPSYVEWQACLELTRDVLKLRKEQTTSGTDVSNAGSRTSSRRGRATKASELKANCPIVKYTEDGNIDYVINCPGPGMPGQ
jgi:hypothetical protein